MTLIPALPDAPDFGPAPVSPAEAELWLARHGGRFGHFIDDRFHPVESGPGLPVYNPATGAVLGRAAQAGPEAISEAVAAARRALGSWSALPGEARAEHLRALARLLAQRQSGMAALATLNDGKAIRASEGVELAGALRRLERYAAWASLVEAEFPGGAPAGVCAQILPVEFPLLQLVARAAPALAAGNTLVIKPAGATPLTAVAFAELCREAGLPRGVLNLVLGDGATGALLAGHPGCNLLDFTGSPATAAQLHARRPAGSTLLTRTGSALAVLVFEDADLDAAVDGVVDSLWSHAGQCCTTSALLLVQEGRMPRFLDRLQARVQTLRIGDPLDRASALGALPTLARRDALRRRISAAVADGATLWQPAPALPDAGAVLAPSLLMDIAPARVAAICEAAGGVAVCASFRTSEEAIAGVRALQHPRHVALWSEDVPRALGIAAAIDAHSSWINSSASVCPEGRRAGGSGGAGERAELAGLLRAHWEGPRAGSPADAAGAADAAVAADAADAADAAVAPAAAGTQGLAAQARAALAAPLAACGQATAWGRCSASERARVLLALARALEDHAQALHGLLCRMPGSDVDAAAVELGRAIARAHHYAALLELDETATPAPDGPLRALVQRLPWGVMAVLCPEAGALLAPLSLLLPALAMGNRLLLLPGSRHREVAAELIRLFESAGLPAGTLQLLQGEPAALASALAAESTLAALWCCTDQAACAAAARPGADAQQTRWLLRAERLDWAAAEAQGRHWLERASRANTVWLAAGT